jgi:hypothetical protein
VTITHVYAADVCKSETTADGDLMVYGKATGPDLDLDQQICDSEWLKGAMPRWAQWGNIREQHGPIAAGVGLETTQTGDDWFLKSLVVDTNTARKVERGVLKGYSIGIKNARVVKDAAAPNGRIVGGEIVEISLVDRPCNPTATMSIAKSADGAMAPVDGAGELLLDLTKATVIDAPAGGDTGKSAAGETAAPQPAAGDGLTLAEVAKSLTTLTTAVTALTASMAAFLKASEQPAEVQPEGVEKSTSGDPKDNEGTINGNADLVKALADAEERERALAADLAKAMAQPVQGGPANMRVASSSSTQTVTDVQKTAAYYRAQAARNEDDRATRAGYLKLAEQAEAAEKAAVRP